MPGEKRRVADESCTVSTIASRTRYCGIIRQVCRLWARLRSTNRGWHLLRRGRTPLEPCLCSVKNVKGCLGDVRPYLADARMNMCRRVCFCAGLCIWQHRHTALPCGRSLCGGCWFRNSCAHEASEASRHPLTLSLPRTALSRMTQNDSDAL